METKFNVGDLVEHKREPGKIGRIRHVEENNLSVMLEWIDDGDFDYFSPQEDWDFQWSNKLQLISYSKTPLDSTSF